METIEKPFPPEGFAFFALLMSYYQEQLARLHLEGEAQVQRFGATFIEKGKAVATEFATHGISFHEEVAPLFVHTFSVFQSIKDTKAAIALVTKEKAKRLKRYRAAVSRITEDAAPFSLAAKSEVKSTWALLEHTDLTRLNEEAAFQMWGEQLHQVNGLSRKEARKHAIWKELERTLFTLCTARGVSDGRTYRLIELVLEILPDGFTAKFKSDAIRHRIKGKSPLRKGTSPENGKAPP